MAYTQRGEAKKMANVLSSNRTGLFGGVNTSTSTPKEDRVDLEGSLVRPLESLFRTIVQLSTKTNAYNGLLEQIIGLKSTIQQAQASIAESEKSLSSTPSSDNSARAPQLEAPRLKMG
jgi:hypothetical protein